MPLLLMAGCRVQTAPVERPLVVVVSGDTAGWLVPCGCAANQSGGLLRRGSYIEQLRATADVVYLDAGGAVYQDSPYDRAKFEAILRGERAMGVAAHNVGAGEAKLGGEFLNQLAAQVKTTFLSCNVRDPRGQLIATPLVTHRTAAGTIAITGVLSDSYASGELRIDPPRDAVLRTIAEAEPFDTLVVLAYLPEAELRELAENLPEADLVIGGPTSQSIRPRQTGPTLWASATNKGKFLVEARQVERDGARIWSGEVVEITDRFADHAPQRANLERFYGMLAERDFSPRDTSFVSPLSAAAPSGYRIAGTDQCRECHQQTCDGWDQSAHAHAWQSLRESGAHVDSYCQQCHTTGFGLPGGFVSTRRSESLVNVGCESCHGPSQAHVQDARRRTANYRQAANRCGECHDRENSPLFAYDQYWLRIAHDEPEQPAAAASDETSEMDGDR